MCLHKLPSNALTSLHHVQANAQLTMLRHTVIIVSTLAKWFEHFPSVQPLFYLLCAWSNSFSHNIVLQLLWWSRASLQFPSRARTAWKALLNDLTSKNNCLSLSIRAGLTQSNDNRFQSSLLCRIELASILSHLLQASGSWSKDEFNYAVRCNSKCSIWLMQAQDHLCCSIPNLFSPCSPIFIPRFYKMNENRNRPMSD